MSRRKIVVEGTTYHWETNGHDIAIIPPKGTGGTRRFSVATLFGCSDDDRQVPITPSDIASLIYWKILEKPMPPKKQTLPPVVSWKPPSVLHWETAPDMPRTYLVQATVALPESGEASIPLEVHETAETARAAVQRLNGYEVERLISKALKSPTSNVLQRRRGDETHAVDHLIAWLRTMPLGGEVPQLKVSVSEVPFKIAA